MSVHQFYPRGQSPMTVSWQGRLNSASTEAEVVDVVRDFMAQVSPYDLARLPEACRPRKMVDANDITNYAFAIVRHHCDAADGTARVAHKLAAFFTSASIRLSQILAAANSDEDESRQSA